MVKRHNDKLVVFRSIRKPSVRAVKRELAGEMQWVVRLTVPGYYFVDEESNAARKRPSGVSRYSW